MNNIEIATLIEIYKEEIGKLTNENIMLKAQLKQIQKDMKKEVVIEKEEE